MSRVDHTPWRRGPMSGLFGPGSKKPEGREHKERARREAMQRYQPMVQEGLARLCPWAFPYARVEGWEIIHVDTQGKRIVDIRVELDGEEGEWYLNMHVRGWAYDDIKLGHFYSNIQPDPVKLYDA